jgi:hypothetical protein
LRERHLAEVRHRFDERRERRVENHVSRGAEEHSEDADHRIAPPFTGVAKANQLNMPVPSPTTYGDQARLFSKFICPSFAFEVVA